MATSVQSDNRNMQRLKDEEQVRQRPAPIFGTNDERGALQSAEEIIMNSIDEAREGHGGSVRVYVDRIVISAEAFNDAVRKKQFKGNTLEVDCKSRKVLISVCKADVEILQNGGTVTYDVITVEDDGRGLPMDWNEAEQMYNWQLALCTLYASGKYNSSQYANSLGLNGLGLTATQYASSFMDVWATYDGKTRYMHFEKGKPIGKMIVSDAIREGTGTKISYQPDPEVFPALRHKNLSADMFLDLLNSQAMLLAGLKIEFSHYELNNTVTFYYENGMAEYVDKVVDPAEAKLILPEAAFYFDDETGTDDPEADPTPYKVDMRIAFNFCRDHSVVKVYHNGSLMFERGQTVDALETGITKAFTDVARANGKLQKSDRFSYKDIESMLICVGSTDAPGHRTWFKNQTKGAINNPFIGNSFMTFVYCKVRYWLENNKGLADRVLNEAVINKRSREEGAEVSKKVIQNLSKSVNFTSKPKKFRDCSSKNVFEREIYIVEGDSALGSVKLACNPRFQAVMPVRGKIINCLKEKITKVLMNDIIVDLYRVLGCGMEVKSKYVENLPEFDLSKLNFGKIIICTDADVDGMHIRCLLITMFYVLSPSLLKAGKVFIAETPLYEISYKKEIRFAFDDNEKAQIINDFTAMGAKPNQIKIQRSKGLGENDPEMMSISTMKPETRRLIPVDYPENDSEVMTYFNALLGDDLETRRLLIEEYFDLTPTDLD